MRGLYLAFGQNYSWNQIKSETSNGIAKKIYNQIQCFENSGLEIDFYNPYADRNQKVYKIQRRLPFAYLYPWRISQKNLSKYDFVYVRKAGFMDGDVILFFKKIRKINPQIKILMEVPTYPYDQELKEAKYIPLMIKDRKWRKKLIKYVDRIITYSRDDRIWGIPTIKISNAILFSVEKRKEFMYRLHDNTIEIIACSMCLYWHGYDRALKGLVEYYQKPKKYRLLLHIVGEGAELPKYKEYVKENNISDKVFFHGYLQGKDLDSIYNRCVIGLDSLGRHRSGVYYNSSLKGKEYGAKGLIIVSGVSSELDYDQSYRYYLKVASDDTSINFDAVVDFFDNLLERETIDTLQNSIMAYTKMHFDYSVVMNKVVEYLKQ